MAVATKRRTSKHAPYVRLLRSKRAQLLEQLRDHRQDVFAERVPEDSLALASLTLLEDLAVGTVQREEQLLGEIEAALRRLRGGVFGTCESCDVEIPERRLHALPWARLCLKCAERRQALSMN